MKTLLIEGKVVQVSAIGAGLPPKITIQLPSYVRAASEDDEDDEDTVPVEQFFDMDTDEETARHFGAHLLDRVRLSITIIPTPRLIDDCGEEDPPS